jgi:hypothetical protein
VQLGETKKAAQDAVTNLKVRKAVIARDEERAEADLIVHETTREGAIRLLRRRPSRLCAAPRLHVLPPRPGFFCPSCAKQVRNCIVTPTLIGLAFESLTSWCGSTQRFQGE